MLHPESPNICGLCRYPHLQRYLEWGPRERRAAAELHVRFPTRESLHEVII